MTFDLLAWGCGFVLTSGARRLLDALSSSELRGELDAAVVKWCRDLPAPLQLVPESLFLVDPDSTAPSGVALQEALVTRGEVPEAQDWISAIEAAWEEKKRVLGDEAQGFYQASYVQVAPHIASLASDLYRVCARDPELSRMTSHVLLSRIVTTQERERAVQLENRPSFLRDASVEVARSALFPHGNYWRFDFLALALRQELSRNGPMISDLESGIFIGEYLDISSGDEVLSWCQRRFAELTGIVQNFAALVRTIKPVLEEDTVAAAKLLRVAENFARLQRTLIDVAIRFGLIPTFDDDVKVLLAQMAQSMVDLVEQFSTVVLGISASIEEGVRRDKENGTGILIEGNWDIELPPDFAPLVEKLAEALMA